MQLPPTDEIVMVSGIHPIRAKKTRYYEDGRFQERILPPPALARTEDGKPNDWNAQRLPPSPETDASIQGGDGSFDDQSPEAVDWRLQPELEQMNPVEKKRPLDDEFSRDDGDEWDASAVRAPRVNNLLLDDIRRPSLDHGDDLGM